MNTKTDRQTGRTLSSECRHCGEFITATITPNGKHVNGEAVTFSFPNLAGCEYSNHALPASMPCQTCGKPLGGSWAQWRENPNGCDANHCFCPEGADACIMEGNA